MVSTGLLYAGGKGSVWYDVVLHKNAHRLLWWHHYIQAHKQLFGAMLFCNDMSTSCWPCIFIERKAQIVVSVHAGGEAVFAKHSEC